MENNKNCDLQVDQLDINNNNQNINKNENTVQKNAKKLSDPYENIMVSEHNDEKQQQYQITSGQVMIISDFKNDVSSSIDAVSTTGNSSYQDYLLTAQIYKLSAARWIKIMTAMIVLTVLSIIIDYQFIMKADQEEVLPVIIVILLFYFTTAICHFLYWRKSFVAGVKAVDDKNPQLMDQNVQYLQKALKFQIASIILIILLIICSFAVRGMDDDDQQDNEKHNNEEDHQNGEDVVRLLFLLSIIIVNVYFIYAKKWQKKQVLDIKQQISQYEDKNQQQQSEKGQAKIVPLQQSQISQQESGQVQQIPLVYQQQPKYII